MYITKKIERQKILDEVFCYSVIRFLQFLLCTNVYKSCLKLLCELIINTDNLEKVLFLSDSNTIIASVHVTWIALSKHGLVNMDKRSLQLLQLCPEPYLIISNAILHQKTFVKIHWHKEDVNTDILGLNQEMKSPMYLFVPESGSDHQPLHSTFKLGNLFKIRFTR